MGRNEVLKKIIDALKEKDYSIAELSKKLSINRNTLIYYINILKNDKLIKITRIEKKERGRPSIIKYTPEEGKEKYFKDRENKSKEFDSRYKNEIIKILEIVKTPIERKELIEKIAQDRSFSDASMMLVNSLYWKDLTSEKVYITNKGKKFLKENSK